jgi:hypothetical protein
MLISAVLFMKTICFECQCHTHTHTFISLCIFTVHFAVSSAQKIHIQLFICLRRENRHMEGCTFVVGVNEIIIVSVRWNCDVILKVESNLVVCVGHAMHRLQFCGRRNRITCHNSYGSAGRCVCVCVRVSRRTTTRSITQFLQHGELVNQLS